jgi:phage head maturation protease
VSGLELFNRAATVSTVRHPERIIEVCAVPYEQDAVVDYHGRPVVETIARHAFGAVATVARKRLVNRDHDPSRTVGVVRQLEDRADGLYAALRIGVGALGDETLDWAADGILDASVCFGAEPDGIAWSPDRRSRRVRRADVLAHVALVPEPAYQGATVVAVRHAAAAASPLTSTPNLDRLTLADLAGRYR